MPSFPQTPPVSGALRRIADLPGPRPLPVLGNLLQVRGKDIHRHVERWADEHGPLFRFQLGQRHFVGVSEHGLIQEVLRHRPEGFRRTRRLQDVVEEMGLPAGLFAAHGEAWRRQRPFVMAALDPGHIRAYYPRLRTVATRLEHRWRRASAQQLDIDLRADASLYSVDIVAGLAFGLDIDTLGSADDAFRQDLELVFQTMFGRILAPLPLWRWFPSRQDREVMRAGPRVLDRVAALVEAARQRMRAEPARTIQPTNLLEAMLAAASQQDHRVGDDEIAGNVLTMLLAGEDTTANTMAWTVWLLSRHPAALDRAVREVDEVLGGGGGAGSVADDVGLEQLSRLPWLEGCIQESMRLKPVAPFMLSEAVADLTLADLQVPRGTVLWLVFRHDTLQARHFPNPHAFDPARWSGELQRGVDAIKRVSMPFGAGPRMCPGRYLALVEIKLALVMMLRRFDLVRAWAIDGAEPRERSQSTMAPEGLRIRLRERDPAIAVPSI